MTLAIWWMLCLDVLFDFVFFYPFFMAYVWMAGGIVHFLLFEWGQKDTLDVLESLADLPRVSILVPCFNEGDNVREVIGHLMQLEYPNYEVIAINDGSTDDTGAQLDDMAREFPLLRVIHQNVNQGKAVGLTTATILAQGEFILGIDGDAILDVNAIGWMLRHFLRHDDVAAVTGNPRIRTRSTLLGRMQVGEFSSFIGLIKRTQQLYGRLFSVSGVIVMFRRKALLDVGFWSTDMLTEDIDISWKLQVAGWRIRYEPRALCWILMPETIRGLYKQRLRWAMGGIQTLLKYSSGMRHLSQRRMWPIYGEYLTSVVWSYSMVLALALALLKALELMPHSLETALIPEWSGLLLIFTCFLQLMIGLLIDYRYDCYLLRYFLWTIWYPLAFWMINLITTVVAVPSVLLRRRGARAVWVSPDRGVKHD